MEPHTLHLERAPHLEGGFEEGGNTMVPLGMV